jgi:hypothetical protein
MRFHKIIGFVFGSALMFYACIPEPLDVKGVPNVKPQIVVSSQIIPDESLVVFLTRTFSALDADEDSDPEILLDQIAVSDALVIITGPSGSDTLQSLDNGVYGGVFIPFEDGEEYQLYVHSESLGTITATTTVKPQITFEDIEAGLHLNGFGDTLAQINYTLNDPPGTNWYMLNVQEVEREDLENNLLNPRAFTKLVEDKDFDGTDFSEVFRVFPRDYAPGDTIAVSLSNISDEYFAFMKLRQDNRFNFIEYLGEPVNYPSNVTGGKGFFNLYIPDVRTFVLQLN